MPAKKLLLCLMLVAGCWVPPRPVSPPDPDPLTPNPIVVVADGNFDASSQSAALARLAERQAKSASIRDGTRRLHGILNELAADGVPKAYCEAVRAAVPAIKPPTKESPARNLNDAEITALKGVK